MRTKLRACVDCGRHIRIVEAACPFCGAELPASFNTPPARGRPVGTLGRAALVIVGASALAACSGGTDTSELDGSADAPDDKPISFADAYGLSFDGGNDVITSADAYGLPFDGSPDAKDAADSSDGGSD